MHNVNVPHFYCFLRKEHLYQDKKFQGEYEKVTVFAAQSNPDRALLFTVMLDNEVQSFSHGIGGIATFDIELREVW